MEMVYSSFVFFIVVSLGYRHSVDSVAINVNAELECEFPPKTEKDFTQIEHARRKRLTTETGLVCLEDYPYTASVRLHGKHWCGGALVNVQWVLTAAQCFDYVTIEEMTVRLGSVYRDFGGILLSLINIQRHPDYKIDMYYPEHNLALAKLNIPVPKSIRIQPVALADANAESPPSFGETAVTGYGSVMNGYIREGVNQELRRMIVKEIPRTKCRLVYGNDYQLQHDNMCLQSLDRGIALCTGDIGDPAVHFTMTERSGVLYGIALFSGTEECMYKSKPGVFAKVAYSRTWIDKVLSDTRENEDEDNNSAGNTISRD